jgi:hypothetical protein
MGAEAADERGLIGHRWTQMNTDGAQMRVGGWRLEVGGWRLEVGGWRLEVGMQMDTMLLACQFA